MTLSELLENWAATQASRTDADPRLEPPAYDDYAESEPERNRLRWAWRDGFEAAISLLREELGAEARSAGDPDAA